MSLGVVEQQGGTLRVDSELGKGSTFEILLPQSDNAPEQSQVQTQPSSTVVNQASTVLVVDDDVDVAEVIRHMLTAQGFSTRVAHSPQQVLDLFDQSRERPDLLISDIVMPDLRGDELVRQLRQQGENLPVIYMTGHATGIAVDMASLGGYPLLHKPFQSAELLDVVQQVISDAPPKPEPEPGTPCCQDA